jgi:F0F1-type ATP synthase membrane subunit a
VIYRNGEQENKIAAFLLDLDAIRGFPVTALDRQHFFKSAFIASININLTVEILISFTEELNLGLRPTRNMLAKRLGPILLTAISKILILTVEQINKTNNLVLKYGFIVPYSF